MLFPDLFASPLFLPSPHPLFLLTLFLPSHPTPHLTPFLPLPPSLSGESNALTATQEAAYYLCALPHLITALRELFDSPSAHAGIVQLAPWASSSAAYNAEVAALRDAQLRAGDVLANVSVITAIDGGDPYAPIGSIHPRRKQLVGARLAAAALTVAYGRPTPFAGPRYSSAVPGGGAAGTLSVTVSFVPGPTSEGLYVIPPSGGAFANSSTCPVGVSPDLCSGFQIAASDGHWYPANATVIGATLVLTAQGAPGGLTPVSTSSAWSLWPITTLYSAAGLPAWPWNAPVRATERAAPPPRAVTGDVLGLWTCAAGAPRQQFSLAPVAGTSAVSVSLVVTPRLVWDIAGPNKDVGTPVHVWGRYTPAVLNQQWSLAADGTIVSSYDTALCLGSGGPYLAALLGIYSCNASDPLQVWSFDAARGSFALAADPTLCVQAGATTASCDLPPFSTFPYCNPALPEAARLADLLSRMTPSEKTAALDSGVPAIPRLGVPSMHSGEALHGAACGCLSAPSPNSTGCPTSFPSPIALGAAMDTELWGEVGLAIGLESRALNNANVGAVWVFAPNINPARDGRWGRIQEVPSESAGVVSEYATAFISGLQGKGGPDPRYLLVASTAKHFVGSYCCGAPFPSHG